MFGVSGKVEVIEGSAPPAGVAALLFCVIDNRGRVCHQFAARADSTDLPDSFCFLDEPEKASEHLFLKEAMGTQKPVSVSLSYEKGLRKFIYILPYEWKRGKWRYACIEVLKESRQSDANYQPDQCVLAEERGCFLLADDRNMIRACSAQVPVSFGYSYSNLYGMHLGDLLSDADLVRVLSGSPDSCEPVSKCIFRSLNGSRLEVDIKAFSAPDNCTLYSVCDASPQEFREEISQVSMRERRRIGQDLHDSIGQLLTGISLLSRSLANDLQRAGNKGCEDAAQISELADDASNQIRQISRRLMPSEIVQRGLFDSLRNLAKVTTNSCAIRCNARIDDSVVFADGAVETHIYRIAQEAVNNAVRHSNATRLDIIVRQQNGLPVLEISDNGKWKEMGGTLGGIGMKTMKYRASVIGGTLKVEVGELGGTRVICRLEADELLMKA